MHFNKKNLVCLELIWRHNIRRAADTDCRSKGELQKQPMLRKTVRTGKQAQEIQWTAWHVYCPRYKAVVQQKNKSKCKSSATICFLFRQSRDSSFLITADWGGGKWINLSSYKGDWLGLRLLTERDKMRLQCRY